MTSRFQHAAPAALASLTALRDSKVREARVSNRGQMSLPAEARHRWNITDGGDVSIIDLGDALLVVPATLDQIRGAIADAVSGGRYASAMSALAETDSDLANC
jgi:bifunctional DNA-binding transcriptional regulator/antitoxin component of YhaV-PrlF toxin-antitoxin module